ncbi:MULTISPECIES: thiamine pyrophosphate-requiring protein [unclassified Iodidimonas]|jgi:acetolactate synthase-1/2/3 large subunit|uniref:thiamine pyrophosphate-requiring protein n=2 Tax=Iodidimonas TaxID=2066486 RepID=UPI0024824E4C|nr:MULTISPECIES: thiamine pyrophosphate-requiring protein [unclassified Iodidimonas]
MMRDQNHDNSGIQDKLDLPVETTAEALLAVMKARGIDYLFANPGTDFPAIIEAYARAPQSGLSLPQPILVPHENAAVSMAHGYYLGSGRMQAAMVHVSVGLANSLCALLNAARENVPIFFGAGRTPITESGSASSRDVSIHWGQEMYDQAGMLREAVVWDYELRPGTAMETMVDRAMALATSDPGGPIYLGMPRETLAEPAATLKISPHSRISPARATGIDHSQIEQAAQILAAAKNPLIITSRSGRDPDAVAALADFASIAACPVIEYRANYLNLPSDHPMQAGFDFTADFADHDVILVLDTPAPWLPARHDWPHKALVIQMGSDPLAQDIPIRGFSADLCLLCRPAFGLPALSQAFAKAAQGQQKAIDARREKRSLAHEKARHELKARLLGSDPQKPEIPARMTPAWVSHCLDRLKPEDAIIVNEIGCIRPVMRFTRPGSFYGPSNAGGLGWGLPASLGLKLAQPDRMVICTLGDGSHMFANPVACHQVAAAHKIATLTIVFNNRRWNAVKTATASVYPDGHAMRANLMPMTALDPSPAFHEIAKACGGYGEEVSDPAAMMGALSRAMEKVAAGVPALLNVITEH